VKVSVANALGLLALTCATAVAEVKMPAIFGDHMVLQEKQTIPVWGTADPGEKIVIQLNWQRVGITADEKGKWRVDLKPVKANSKPITLMVSGANTLTFTDVLIGDVWLASGQSNMVFGLKQVNDGATAVQQADQPMIRIFTVPRVPAAMPQADIAPTADPMMGKWLVCSPATIAAGSQGFSAVAYFFGREIQTMTGNPIGLISSNVGGTPAQAWLGMEGLEEDKELERYVNEHRALLNRYDAAIKTYPEDLAAYKEKEAEWTRVSKPVNDAALKQWQLDTTAATAAGQPAPPRPKTVSEPRMPDPTGGSGAPTALFNGMIAPLIPYAIKGTIWYQGEANGGRGAEYRVLFPRLIQDWRKRWAEGDFPFLFVQLPNYNQAWGMLREAQLSTLSMPKTGMAVTIDLGTVGNIHPPYKREVAHRLALAAQHVAYDKELVYSGPTYKSMTVKENTIRISFTNVGGGLTLETTPVSGRDITPAPTDELITFQIAGKDKQWHAAQAKIDGEEVVVSSTEVASPVAVRYGWDPPPVCNLYNKEHLPASPFRTDDWQ